MSTYLKFIIVGLEFCQIELLEHSIYEEIGLAIKLIANISDQIDFTSRVRKHQTFYC